MNAEISYDLVVINEMPLLEGTHRVPGHERARNAE
jgi:hypothetical protein